MGFTMEELSTFGTLFESIGFSEIELIADTEDIEQFSFVLEPVSKNACWVVDLWQSAEEYQWIWTKKDRLLNLFVTNRGTCMITVTDSDDDKVRERIKTFNGKETHTKKSKINEMVLEIWDSMRISNWLPTICADKNPPHGEITIFNIGPFDAIKKFSLPSATEYAADADGRNKNGKVIFFGGINNKERPIMINMNDNTIIGAISCGRQHASDLFLVEGGGRDIISRNNGTFIIRTTIEEGAGDAMFRLPAPDWHIIIEDTHVLCRNRRYCKVESSCFIEGVFVIPNRNIVYVSWEPPINS